jgi:hypothetical protein
VEIFSRPMPQAGDRGHRLQSAHERASVSTRGILGRFEAPV